MVVGVLNGEPGGLGDLGWRRRRGAGGERRRLVSWPVLVGLGWGRRRSGGRGSWGWRGRGRRESRWVFAVVRGGGWSRGRGSKWTVDGASELHRPVRLRDAAGICCWHGGVPQGLQGGRGAGPRHFNKHTQTGVMLMVKLLRNT